MSILQYIRKIDLFGPQVKIRFQNQKQYKTALGGCFTIILFIGTILLVLRYFEEMITRDNPTLMFREELWEKGQIQNIELDLFNYRIGVFDTDSKIYMKSADIFAVAVDKYGKNHKCQLTLCQIQLNNFNNIQNSQQLQQFSKNEDYYCFSEKDIQKAKLMQIDYESTFNLEIKFPKQKEVAYELQLIQLDYFIDTRNYNNPFQPYWKVTNVNLAQNLRSQNIRVSLTVKQIITDKGYLTTFNDSLNILAISNLDIYKPSESTTETIGNNGQNDQSTTIMISYSIERKIQIQTVIKFNNIFLYFLKNQNSQILQLYNFIATIIYLTAAKLFSLSLIQKFPYQIQYYKLLKQRNYIKIIDAVAIVGGFIKSSMVILRFLSKPFTKMALQISHLNELFCFDESPDDNVNGDGQLNKTSTLNKYTNKEDQEKEENILINKILNQEIQNQSSRQCPESSVNKKDQEEAQNIFKKFMKIGQNTLSMGALDYIKYYVCCFFKQKKKSQIKKSKKKVNERLDIVYILKKLVEIDKLKMILLNDSQRRVFDYLPKPLVKLQSQKSKIKSVSLLKPPNVHVNARTEWSLIHSEFSPYQKAILAVKAFQNIMKSETAPLSLIDLKLIEMLDPEIIKRFCALQLNTLTDLGQQFDQQEKKLERLHTPKINRELNTIKFFSEPAHLITEQLQAPNDDNISLLLGNLNEKIDENILTTHSPLADQEIPSTRSNTGRDNIIETIKDTYLKKVKNNFVQQNKIENQIEQKNNIQNEQKDKEFTLNIIDIGKSKITESIIKSNLQKLRPKQPSQNSQNVQTLHISNSNKSNSINSNSNKIQLIKQFFTQRKQINSFIINSDSIFIDQQFSIQQNNKFRSQTFYKPDYNRSINQLFDIFVSQNTMQLRTQRLIKPEDQRLNTINESIYQENDKQVSPQSYKRQKDRDNIYVLQSSDNLNQEQSSQYNYQLSSSNTNPFESIQPQFIAQERSVVSTYIPSIPISQNKKKNQRSSFIKSEVLKK